MIKLTALLILVSLRFLSPSDLSQTTMAAFGNPSTRSITTLPKLMNFSGSINNSKVFLQWMVYNNESAEQFEVEKSTDGKNFTVAALLSATGNPITDNYFFYEVSNKTFYYRIKLISKEQKTEYSSVVKVGPKA